MKTFPNKLYPNDYKDEDEIFIGYSTINLMNKLNMKTVRYIDNPKDNIDKLYENGWFPTFVKKKEWEKKANKKPIRYKLERI